MISKIVYKYKKLVVCILFVLGVAIYFKAKVLTGSHIDHTEVQHAYTGLGYIQSQDIVTKEMIMKSLSKTQQIVGLDGHTEKFYKYEDSMFKHHGWLKDFIGNRSVSITSQVYFKTGINISDLTSNDGIRIIGNTLHIKLDKDSMRLISLNIPFDQMEFKDKVGVLRTALTLEDKQHLYTEISKIAESDIMTNQEIKDNTYEGVSESLKALLGKIENVKQVIVSQKIE